MADAARALGIPVDQRQRQPLQRDERRGDLADARRRRGRADRGRRARRADGVSGGGRRACFVAGRCGASADGIRRVASTCASRAAIVAGQASDRSGRGSARCSASCVEAADGGPAAVRARCRPRAGSPSRSRSAASPAASARTSRTRSSGRRDLFGETQSRGGRVVRTGDASRARAAAPQHGVLAIARGHGGRRPPPHRPDRRSLSTICARRTSRGCRARSKACTANA